jgi:hypothetical protein
VLVAKSVEGIDEQPYFGDPSDVVEPVARLAVGGKSSSGTMQQVGVSWLATEGQK